MLQANFLGFCNLAVAMRGTSVVSTELEVLTNYAHAGTMTDLVVSEISPGSVLVAFGTTVGTVYLVRLTVPLAPGSSPDELQVLNLTGGDEAQLEPWLQPHAQSVAALDVQTETKVCMHGDARAPPHAYLESLHPGSMHDAAERRASIRRHPKRDCSHFL